MKRMWTSRRVTLATTNAHSMGWHYQDTHAGTACGIFTWPVMALHSVLSHSTPSAVQWDKCCYYNCVVSTVTAVAWILNVSSKDFMLKAWRLHDEGLVPSLWPYWGEDVLFRRWGQWKEIKLSWCACEGHMWIFCLLQLLRRRFSIYSFIICRYVGTCHSTHGEVRGQLVVVSYLPLPFGFWGL